MLRSAPHEKKPLQRRRVEVGGRVQGVGFRPFVWRLAAELELSGEVGNSSQGAWIDIQGPAGRLEEFLVRLRRDLPAPGAIHGLTASALEPVERSGFRIVPSDPAGDATAEVLPDLAVCPDCLRELFNPKDRRYRYPFINCTHCGPRYSIVLGVPYDRERTTMAGFRLCPDCRREYEDPADRRYHAQPVACPRCGPRLWYAEPDGREVGGDPIALAAHALQQGSILGIKGLGGFHLACRADDAATVQRLRERKHRDAKPFAVMLRGLAEARAQAHCDAAVEALLGSPARPIVLAPKRKGASIAWDVAPDSSAWGLLLPYTPLHHLLMQEVDFPLVMTSGNPSGEPLCSANGEAVARLGRLCDAFLMHDRDIARPVDDSVLLPSPAGLDGAPALVLRRARGLAPKSIRLSTPARGSVLALGGEMKSSLCLAEGGRAVLSEHLGELDNPAAFRNFLAAIDRLKGLLLIEPHRLAADLHPLYTATRWARGQGLPLTLVQHHHAHVVSAMAEHGLEGTVVGVACDGTGYGGDGSIWGGEILVCDLAAWRRAGHLAPFELPGGDAAALDPWRPALGLLRQAYPGAWHGRLDGLRHLAGDAPVDLAVRRMEQPAGSVACSSAGRLFDGVAALLGYCERNRYEAEAAMILQHEAEAAGPAPALPFELSRPEVPGGPWRLETAPMIRALMEGGDPGRLARGFHEGLAGLLAEGARRVAEESGLRRVVLSGGCFANALLLGRCVELLRAAGLDVYTHRDVPCGDGGLALGQAVVAAQAP